MWRRAALAALLALGGCEASPPIAARPALWRMRDGDTTIWLLGSIHALPPQIDWQTPAVTRAMRDADTLILEIPPADPAAARAAFRAVAVAPGLPPLLDRVAPGDRGTVQRALAVAGQAPGALDAYRTWAAALAITAGAGAAHGASGTDGVEAVVTSRFAGKTIGALETQAGQLAVFDRLPERAQRALLVEAAQAALSGKDPAFAAWARGDEAALAATLAPLHAEPVLERALVTDRNARWTAAIVRCMARPGRVLLVVGAGHLVGPGSVIARLRARGLTVVREK